MVYLRACSRVLGLATGKIRAEWVPGQRPPNVDPRRTINTCEECGCLFLTHSSDPRAEVCWPCTRRERDKFEREQDRLVYARYLKERGPGNPLRTLQPEPLVKTEPIPQGVLF